MKKVALLSFHTAYNYGAALQAFALQETVSDMAVDCAYINYVNESRQQEYDMIAQIRRELKKKNLIRVAKLICGIPFMAGRKRHFEQFYHRYLTKTAVEYHSSKEAEALNDDFDKFIVGSDQVWNPENNGSDCAFMLDFVQDERKRISYSSSFGISEVPEHMIQGYTDNLTKFYRISTRELAGVKLIRELSGRDAHLVLDPVFLPATEVWERMISTAKKNTKEYIFFYTNRNTQLNDFLGLGYPSDALEYHILSSHVSLKDFLDQKRKIMFTMSPEKFLEEIADAKLVVTASFHCLAFSIILHKQFVVFLTGNQGKDERILNILRICGLENRVFRHGAKQSDIDKPIDYFQVEERLKRYRENSRKYLYNAIFDEEDIDFSCNRIELSDNRFCNNDFCTGCTACANACPRQAIIMTMDDEGFLFPNVDENLCNHCGICRTKCQVYENTNENTHTQRYFAVKNLDTVRQISSSGGAFTAFAKKIFSENGVVCAAAMDKNFVVKHRFAFSMSELTQMRGTYYVQSNLEDSFVKIKRFLLGGRKVLFIGTPCQVNGLKLFLGKEYDDLLTVDIICHGVPSPMVFESFVEYLKSRGKLTDFCFRDKTDGWEGYHVSAIIDEKKYVNRLWLQSFSKMFSHNLINRRSCASCRYTNYNRIGDITIGDFWGIQKRAPEYADKLGVSLVMINSEGGEKFFNSLDSLVIKEFQKDETKQNSLLHPSPMNSSRNLAFRMFYKDGYCAIAKTYGEVNAKGFLKSIVRKCF